MPKIPNWTKPQSRKLPPFNAFLLSKLRRLPNATTFLRSRGVKGHLRINEILRAKKNCKIETLDRYLKAFGLKIAIVPEGEETFPKE